jgi:hypothetical protein
VTIFRTILILFIGVVLLAVPALLHAQIEAGYEAVYSDGSRIEGRQLTGWGAHPGSPQLDSTTLRDPKRPLRWLRNRSLQPWRMIEKSCAYIEFVGGDRIVGSVVTVQPFSDVDDQNHSAYLLVKLAAPRQEHRQILPQLVRVMPERIERIVFHAASPRRFQPGTLFYLDGRQLAFDRHRWTKDSLFVLLNDGSLTVKLSDIEEVHFPQVDPWQAYYQELAVLNPDCMGQLIRLETTSGLIVTGSETRFTARAFNTDAEQQAYQIQRMNHASQIKQDKVRLVEMGKAVDLARKNHSEKKAELQRMQANDRKPHKMELATLKKILDSRIAEFARQAKRLSLLEMQQASRPGPQGSSNTWSHIIHPIWSLDCLQIPFRIIDTRWSFAPDQVPLCRVRPAATVDPPLFNWRVNRNSTGWPLRSGGQQYAWGFAVHAYSELRFLLPSCASAFHSTIGLDHNVKSGGCAQALIYVGSINDKPRYQSPLLIGSKTTVDTGRIQLHLPLEGPKQLILQANPVSSNFPSGADPLNIRDSLDWLDPRLELDTAQLRDQVRQQIRPLMASSREWTPRLDPRGVYTWSSYLHKRRSTRLDTGQFLTLIQAQKQPLSLSREMMIGSADKWLAVYLSIPSGESPGSEAVNLRIGTRQIQPQKIPTRQSWQDWGAPLLFNLDEYQGKSVTLELTQLAGGKPLHWRAVKFSKRLPAAYRLAHVLERAGHADLAINQGLGQLLQSPQMNDPEKLALIEIYQHGGIIEFNRQTLKVTQPGYPYNVLVGEDWKGGDTTFMAFQNVRSLTSIVVIEGSGVSIAAGEKLMAVIPDLELSRLERIPSTEGKRCSFWMQNHTGNQVEIYWITTGGKLSLRDTLHNTSGRKVHHSNVGCRFEAYVNGKQVSKFTVTPGRIWKINLPK